MTSRYHPPRPTIHLARWLPLLLALALLLPAPPPTAAQSADRRSECEALGGYYNDPFRYAYQISQMAFQSNDRWPEILEATRARHQEYPDVFANPGSENALKVGDCLYIPGVDADTLRDAAMARPLPDYTGPVVAGNLRYSGSSTVFPLTELVAAKFANDVNGTGGNISVDGRPVGSEGGYDDFCRPDAGFLFFNSSQRFSGERLAACGEARGGEQLVGFVVGKDAILIIFHPNNQAYADGLTKDTISSLLTAANWSEVFAGAADTQIQSVLPGPRSGTLRELLRRISTFPLAPDEFERLVRQMTDNAFTASEDDCGNAKSVAESPVRFGVIPSSALADCELGAGRRLTLVPVECDPSVAPCTESFIVPSASNVPNEQYPLARDVFIYTTVEQLQESELLRSFLRYLLDPAVAQVGLAQANLYASHPDVQQAQRDCLEAIIANPAAGPAALAACQPARYTDSGAH